MNEDRVIFVSGANQFETFNVAFSLVRKSCGFDGVIADAHATPLQALRRNLAAEADCTFVVIVENAQVYTNEKTPCPLHDLVKDFPRLTFIFCVKTDLGGVKVSLGIKTHP